MKSQLQVFFLEESSSTEKYFPSSTSFGCGLQPYYIRFHIEAVLSLQRESFWNMAAARS